MGAAFKLKFDSVRHVGERLVVITYDNGLNYYNNWCNRQCDKCAFKFKCYTTSNDDYLTIPCDDNEEQLKAIGVLRDIA